jgi:hypothetical protein
MWKDDVSDPSSYSTLTVSLDLAARHNNSRCTVSTPFHYISEMSCLAPRRSSMQTRDDRHRRRAWTPRTRRPGTRLPTDASRWRSIVRISIARLVRRPGQYSGMPATAAVTTAAKPRATDRAQSCRRHSQRWSRSGHWLGRSPCGPDFTALRHRRQRPVLLLRGSIGPARERAEAAGGCGAARVGGAPPPTLRFLRVQPDHAGLQGGFARGTSDVQCTTISP